MNDNIDYCHHDSKTLNTNYYQVLNGGRSSGKTFQTINMYEQKYKKLQSNWNSLRECIIGVIEGAREELNTIIHTTDTSTEDGLKYVNQCSREFDVIRKNLEIALDKMNELESGDISENIKFICRNWWK